MPEKENSEKRSLSNFPVPKFRTSSGEWNEGEIVKQGFTPDGSGYRVTRPIDEQLKKINSKEHLATMNNFDIVHGIAKGTITTPDAVDRLFELHTSKTEVDRRFDTDSVNLNILESYCVEQAQEALRYTRERSEKDVVALRNIPDYSPYPQYIFEAAAEQYREASNWYAMAGRLAKRQEESKQKANQ